MLFNSYEFVFVFLPLTLAGFAWLGRRGSTQACLVWLTAASIAFYAWWNPINLLIIAPSVLLNYAAARALLRWGDDKPRLAQALMIVGVIGNLAFLSYFKYKNFFMQVSNDAFGTDFVFTQIVLPLGISFITFQKIAFLVDVYTGRVRAFTFRSYCLFVFFFPQLIAGPIVHYREMMPQFDKSTGRIAAEDVAVGIGIFSLGLFKKVILADGIAVHVSPIYAAATGGEPVTLLYAWLATVGFTLQVYFDFSGYSEMAIGAARLFGIRLPMNFNSPLRATSMIDFWGRWHVTLVRFLTDYVFNPMAFAITRRRLAARRPVLSGPGSAPSAFLVVLVLPTLATMLLSGLWHGAGYGYLAWGLLHGSYLVVNHAWNTYRPRAWSDAAWYPRVMTSVGFVLTFAAVVLAMAFFRAPTIGGGLNIAAGMFGFNGISLPMAIGNQIGAWLPSFVTLEWSSGKGFVQAVTWTVLLLAVAWLLPNTLEVFARFAPALGFTADATPPAMSAGCRAVRQLQWKPGLRWAGATALFAAIGILALGQPTEFLYWQF
jgi:alginate O-acetyltransferase complex protein AlgI